MILEQNYRKIAQYTQKSFKLYSRRYLADLMLQILRKKPNLNPIPTTIPINSKSSTFLQKDSQIQSQHFQKEKQWQKSNFAKTIKNIDNFNLQQIPTNLTFLKYGDFVFLQIYNSGMNPSDKNQRMRVYSQLNTLKYCKLIHLQNEYLSKKKSLFQIINPFDPFNKSLLNGDSVFCLKQTVSGKYLSSTHNLKTDVPFGYEISLNEQINPDCFLQFQGVQSKINNIVSYQPLGIKLGDMYLRAQSLQISCNIDGSVFYLDKAPINSLKIESDFVRIKSVVAQKFLSSSEIEMSKIMSKRVFSNVIIQDENGLPVKENQLVFGTLDFYKNTQSDLQITSSQQETLKNVWILCSNQINQFSYQKQIKFIHAISGKFLVIKQDKSVKLSSNPLEASSFQIYKKLYDQCKDQEQKQKQNIKINSKQFSENNQNNKQYRRIKEKKQYQNEEIQKQCYEIKFQGQSLIVLKSGEELGSFCLSLIGNDKKRNQNMQEDKRIKFQMQSMDLKEEKLIEQLIEIQSFLRRFYVFVERVGFILDERSETLRFCVQQIKKSKNQILYFNSIMTRILSQIQLIVTPKNQHHIKIRTVQNYIKEMKILQTLIAITKIIHLKISKSQHSLESLSPNFNSKNKSSSQKHQQVFSQTPFQVCSKYFATLNQQILDIIYLLIRQNKKSSAIVIQQSNFFNKLLLSNPVKIGSLLQQSVRNLSLLTNKASNNDHSELLNWAKFIQTISQSNLKVQITYIKIIAEVLVDPNDQGISFYQNKCRELLFNQRNKKKVIPRFGVQDQKPTITFQTMNPNDFLYANPNLFQIQPYSGSEACFFIEDFFVDNETNKTKDYIEYLMSIIRLMRNMCKDRNKKLIKIADEHGFDKLHIVACLNSTKLSLLIKMQYLLLYSSILIDQDPFLHFERRQIKCHIWTKINEYNLQSKVALIFKQYSDLNTAIQKLKQFDIDILPFIQSYLLQTRQNISRLFLLVKQNDLYRWKDEIKNQMDSFGLFLRFLFEAMSLGYLSTYQIKRYVYFSIRHYQSLCNIFQYIIFTNLNFQLDKSFLLPKQQFILTKILNILSLNQNIWIDLICLNLLKIFEKNYTNSDTPLTAIELRNHCWKLLNLELPFQTSDEHTSTLPKNNPHSGKKKTTTKNMFFQQRIPENNQEKSNNQFDQQIGKFLIRMLLMHSQMSHSESYSKIVSVIAQREKRNCCIYESLCSFLILNGKKQQNLYRDYSGRTPGKILNVNRIFELVERIKNSSSDEFEDPDSIKKIKEKLLELNNLVNKIRRQLAEMKEDDKALFNKMQKIIEKLNIHSILIQLLQFSYQTIYSECITNLNKFFIEFIWENTSNKKKLSNYLHLFLKNIKIQKSSFLISELYQVLPVPQKRKFIQVLFENLRFSNSKREDILTKQNILQTVYRILRKTQQRQIMTEIKSLLTFQMFKMQDLSSLINMQVNLSTQYINILCELASDCQFFYSKIKKNFPKNILRNMIYQQSQYLRKSCLLKLFYHFYLKNNLLIQTQEIQDIISSFILVQIQHLPSAVHCLALQNLQVNQKDFTNKKSQNQNYSQSQQNIAFLKRKFQDLILLEKSLIQPSQQQKYWNFVFNVQDQEQMSLINFTILLLKVETQSIPCKNGNSKKLSKSVKYQGFISYLTELCDFLKEIFKKNSSKYQRKLFNKLQEILIFNQQRYQNRQKTVNLNVSEQDKKFITQFFQDLSKIITGEDVSYQQILKCGNVTNAQLGKRRSGQNVEKMILQQQFISFIKKLGQNVINIKQFNEVINQKRLTNFFNLYRCNKIHKINIYKFIQKLIEYLESLKSKNITELNDPSKTFRIQRKVNNESLDFSDKIDDNQLIQTHFISYYERYEVVLKLLILKKWNKMQQNYFILVIQDLTKQSDDQFFRSYNFNRENKSLFLVQFYFSQMCGNSAQRTKIKMKQQKYLLQEKDFINKMLQFDLRQEKGCVTFSKLVLMILKQVNTRFNIKLMASQKGICNYIKKKLEVGITQSSLTLNQILMELVINFNKTKNKSQIQQINSSQLQYENQIFKYVSHLGLQKQICLLSLQQQKYFSFLNSSKNFQPRQLALSVYEQIIKILDKQISLISHFNFKYTVNTYSAESNYFEIHVPTNFKFKLSILSYGLTNGLINHSKIVEIQNCFIKVLYLWAVKKYDFQDVNWFSILEQMINLIDQHLKDLKRFAFFLANSQIYINRYQELVKDCCIGSIKATNLKITTKIRLLNLLTQFHIKFYLQNQQNELGKIFNQLDFQLLASTANDCYQHSIKPKLQSFENEVNCELQDSQHQQTCSYQFCNEYKLTKNDNLIMETFVTLLIIIRLGISLKNKNLFHRPLATSSFKVLTQIDQTLKNLDLKTHTLDWIQFYKKYIGMVFFVSEQGSLITLHFKIPYIQNYSSRAMKQQALYLLKRQQQSCIEQKLQKFSKYFEAELEGIKNQQRIPFVHLIFSYEKIIRRFIITVNFIHIMLLTFTINPVNQVVFYPFTIFFIFFRILLTFNKYKRALHIIDCYQQETNLSLLKRLFIFMKQKVFISGILVILYVISLFVEDVFGFIIILEILTIRQAFNLFMLLLKTFTQNFITVLISLGILMTFFGIIDWQKGQNQNFLKDFSNVLKQFYTFSISNMKISSEYQFIRSKQIPFSFILYLMLALFFIYRNLQYFMAEIKREKDQLEKIENRCIICKKKSTDFQSQGFSFEDHVRFQHNVFHYIYFFIYLRREYKKSKQNLKNIELSIKQRIDNKNYGFMNI